MDTTALRWCTHRQAGRRPQTYTEIKFRNKVILKGRNLLFFPFPMWYISMTMTQAIVPSETMMRIVKASDLTKQAGALVICCWEEGVIKIEA